MKVMPSNGDANGDVAEAEVEAKMQKCTVEGAKGVIHYPCVCTLHHIALKATSTQ